MYNEKQKSRFIEQSSFTQKQETFMIWLFNKIENYEAAIDVDISAMQMDELLSTINNVACMRESSNFKPINLLRKYIDWCIRNDCPNVNANIYKINTKLIAPAAIKGKVVSSPLHLQQCLDSMFPKEDKKTVDNTFRCACWLLYGGVLPEDLEKITVFDVDLTHMVVKYNGFEVPIYREAVASVLNCINLKSFAYMHSNYPEDYMKARIDGDGLLRGYTPFSIRNFKNRLAACQKQCSGSSEATNVQLSATRIWMSGLFYTTYENELLGVTPDFRNAAIITYKNEKEDITDSEVAAALSKKRSMYLSDYKRWKEAYRCK